MTDLELAQQALPPPTDYGYRDEGGTWVMQNAYAGDQMLDMFLAGMAKAREIDAAQQQGPNLYSELAEALGCDCMDSHAARLSRATRANAAFTAQKQKAADDWVATQEGRNAQQQEQQPDLGGLWSATAGAARLGKQVGYEEGLRDAAQQQEPSNAAAWREKWPNHCKRCHGWGGSSYEESHGFRGGGSETIFDLCGEDENPLNCHRCGRPGLSEDMEGPCKFCNWNFDDGEPSL
jgi:hypothetical protein